jgi:hypothetical protein
VFAKKMFGCHHGENTELPIQLCKKKCMIYNVGEFIRLIERNNCSLLSQLSRRSAFGIWCEN